MVPMTSLHWPVLRLPTSTRVLVVAVAAALAATLPAHSQQPSAARGSDVNSSVHMPGTPAASSGLTAAEVVAVDAQRRRLTLRHGGLRQPSVAPGDTVFEVVDGPWLRGLKPGDRIGVAAERAPGGALVIVRSGAAPEPAVR
jgi:Cu/Ag efflux protein CusF